VQRHKLSLLVRDDAILRLRGWTNTKPARDEVGIESKQSTWKRYVPGNKQTRLTRVCMGSTGKKPDGQKL
jgi:hypothetical protein